MSWTDRRLVHGAHTDMRDTPGHYFRLGRIDPIKSGNESNDNQPHADQHGAVHRHSGQVIPHVARADVHRQVQQYARGCRDDAEPECPWIVECDSTHGRRELCLFSAHPHANPISLSPHAQTGPPRSRDMIATAGTGPMILESDHARHMTLRCPLRVISAATRPNQRCDCFTPESCRGRPFSIEAAKDQFQTYALQHSIMLVL